MLHHRTMDRPALRWVVRLRRYGHAADVIVRGFIGRNPEGDRPVNGRAGRSRAPRMRSMSCGIERAPLTRERGATDGEARARFVSQTVPWRPRLNALPDGAGRCRVLQPAEPRGDDWGFSASPAARHHRSGGFQSRANGVGCARRSHACGLHRPGSLGTAARRTLGSRAA